MRGLTMHKQPQGLIYPTQTLRGRIQCTWLWRLLIGGFWGPAYALLWEYILNARAKIMYWKSGYPRGNHLELQQSGLEIIEDDPDFTKFANEIRAAIPAQVLESERQRLLSESDELSFACQLLPHLDERDRYAVLRFALSPKVLEYVISYMRVVPRLSEIHLQLNVAHPSMREPVGSARWHRDGSGRYRAVNLFMCVSNVDEGSGVYSAIPATRIPIYEVIPTEVKDMAESPWRRGRISDAQMNRYVDPAEIKKLQGKAGTTAIVDPHLVYHKGGHCSERDRLMIAIHFCTEEAEGWDSTHFTDWVNFDHPEVKELLKSPLNRFVLAGRKSSAVYRIRRFWWLINTYILSYYAKPRKAA